ncbi:MFS transporter [Streptomyces sp. SID12488]|uniref:MFS transporter n=1 Tax=Streptomyces sp. SID12488 TaxID=2706040 RepID=UPI0013DA1FDA|nr:MFS transporter [Streptomyces sp. SID12488]NEA67020.1 MFS transporter [Streptomyces sp. SID12488]
MSPLSGRSFRLLWTGQSISSVGNTVAAVAFVFAVLEVGGSAADIGYIMAAQTVAKVVFILAGGVWADRLPRQAIMLACDLVQAGVQITLAVLLLTGQAEIWHLACGAVLFGIAQAFFGPASTGLLPETVSTDELQQSNALMGFSGSAFSIVGPALAGVLIVGLGPGVVFAVDALTFVISAVSLSLLRLAPRLVSTSPSFWGDLSTGWREVVMRPWYWINLIAHSLWNFAVAAFFVLGPVVAADQLGGASSWGLIASGSAAGAVIGGLVSLRIKPKRPLIAGNLALLLTALPLLALAKPLGTWVIVCSTVLSGMGLTFLGVIWTATMQELIPDEVRSRVDSYDWMLSMVVAPLGMALVGPVAVRSGTGPTLVGAALLIAVPCALTVLVPAIRAVRRGPDGRLISLDRGGVPRSGPADAAVVGGEPAAVD